MIELTTALNVTSTLALIGALAFAGLQVRTANRFRAEQAALSIIHTIQSEGWTQSIGVITSIPAGVTAAQIEALGPEVGHAIAEYGIRIETVGYMVFRGIVAIENVEELLGGMITLFWSRVKPWIEHDRERSSNLRNYEWVQWLADRLESRGTGLTLLPAHLAHADWKLTGGRYAA